VVVVSGVRLHREGLIAALSGEDGIEVDGSTGNLQEAQSLTSAGSVDVVLLDLPATEKNRTELAAAVRTAIHTRFVILSSVEQGTEVVAWAEAGASGIIDPDSSLDELRAILTTVVCGERTCSPRIAATLMREAHVLAQSRRSVDGTDGRLTQRESETLRLICEGLSNKEIAAHLSLRLPTVKNHVHRSFEKIGARNRAEAVAIMVSRRKES
jgi:DNA-binding NarL/FixJ family response regulator